MPRTRSLAWSQLKVGILAIVGLVLTAMFIFFIGGQAGFGWQQYHLKTRFNDIQGLKTGAVVRVAGVEVGTVDDIRFVGTEVEVVLKVSKAMRERIRTDSRASIGTLSLLGAPVIEVSPGKTGPSVPDWGYVPSQRPYGQLADVAEGATRSLGEATRLLQDLRAGKGTVGKLFTDDALYRDLATLVGGAEQVVNSLNKGDGTIARLIQDPAVYREVSAAVANLSDITGRVRRGEGGLGKLLQDEEFARSVSSMAGNLDEVTARLKRGEGTAGKLLTDEALYTRLNSVSDRLDHLVGRLNEGEGTAGRLLHDRQLYENMNEAANELRALLGEIRKDPKKYLNIKVSLF